jgi:two-component system invasion response regulator UvrY
VRIFIASADKTLRLALQLLLESEPGMVVIGMSDRSAGLLTVVRASQAEVLLLDAGLANHSLARLVSDLHHLECRPQVIVLSSKPQTRAATLAAGAEGFISKSKPPDELLPLLRKIRLSDTHSCPPVNSSM